MEMHLRNVVTRRFGGEQRVRKLDVDGSSFGLHLLGEGRGAQRATPSPKRMGMPLRCRIGELFVAENLFALARWGMSRRVSSGAGVKRPSVLYRRLRLGFLCIGLDEFDAHFAAGLAFGCEDAARLRAS